ncbi:TonB-dependent receptor plug domain-containing protein [Geoalkalibacter halelectricus]|uniref:TonB-dependent receptor plug domain-containing protein n=1 Tax=Geoalkalibacter halelectricus TaxID=2847045 RepID=UPI003D1926A6
MLKGIFRLLFVLSLSTPALAQPQTFNLPEIVVTASRWDEPRTDVPQSLTVISRDEIESRGTPFLTELLRTRSDLFVVQNGGAGKNATLLLRGGNGRQALVLVDGVRVNSPSTGAADLGGLLTDDIERIEILKGAQSTLYGSEAMAGVVNIITRKGAGLPKTNLLLEAGSFSTRKASGSLSGGTERHDYRLSATWFDTQGISAARSGTEPDGYTNTTLSARLGYSPSARTSLDLNLRYAHDRSELDDFEAGVGMVDALNWIQKRDDYLVALRGTIFPLDNYEQSLGLSLAGQRLKSEDPDTLWNNARINNLTRQLDWQHVVDLDRLTLSGGIAYRREAVENKEVFDEAVDNKAGYVNAKLRLLDQNLILDAGLRYDDHETFGDELTYRIGALYHLRARDLRIRANHGSGFRAPSLNELFFPFYGNPDLRPEKSTAWDVGLEQDLFAGRLTLGATWFQQRYRDLIQTNFATFTADNIGRARVKGLELTAAARPLDTLLIQSSYTWLDALDVDAQSRLPLRPRAKVVSSVEYTFSVVSLGTDHIYVTRRFDSSTGRDLSAYGLVNLRGAYALTKALSVYARIDNLFDKDYEEAGDFGTPGFAAFGGLRVSL